MSLGEAGLDSPKPWRRRSAIIALVTAHTLPSLRDFLIHPSRPAGTFTYHELQGFLFAVASSPQLVEPSQWLAAIFNDQEANYASLAEAQHVVHEIMALYNEVNAAVLEGTPSLPADCFVSTDGMVNFDHDPPLRSEERRVGKEWRSRGSPYH